MTTERQVDRLLQYAGDLVEQHAGESDLPDRDEYRGDPVGFIREFLGDEMTPYQERIARLVLGNPQVTVRSCHAAGKDWLAARLALWWTYARGGLVILTGPTATQVEEILMRGEVREAFRRSGLPGQLHVRALRPSGDGKAGILAKTGTGISGLTGFHQSRVLVVITEAQDPEIEHAWDAAFACTTGADDRILTLGNPTQPDGRFYRSHQGGEWQSVKIAASDIPNVREGTTVVPGLLTRQGVDRFATEYGERSGFYKSRVLAEFPAESEEGLFRRDWLRDAVHRHEAGDLLRREQDSMTQCVLGVDVARHGADKTVVAIRRGAVLEGFRSWSGADTEETADRVQELAWEMGPVHPKASGLPAVSEIVVDAVGVGAGVYDNLNNRDDPWDVHEHKGSRSAWEDDRYRNVRAESYWTLRERARSGSLAIPGDEEFVEELMALRWRPGPKDKVQLESKVDLADRIGRSPDRADAAAMAFYFDGSRQKAKVGDFAI